MTTSHLHQIVRERVTKNMTSSESAARYVPTHPHNVTITIVTLTIATPSQGYYQERAVTTLPPPLPPSEPNVVGGIVMLGYSVICSC